MDSRPARAHRRRRSGRWRALAVAALAWQLGGCASAGGPVAVYAPAGSRQCEPPAPGARDAVLSRLAQAGVAASAPRCGHDGRVRAALCGLPDGRIVVVDVSPDALPAARAAGWKPLADLPDAVEQACP